jgi:hypothetical protein
MVTESAPGQPGAVFFDPSGRRIRLLAWGLAALLGMAAGLTALLIVGLASGAHPPHLFSHQRPAPGVAGAGRGGTPVNAHRPAGRPAPGRSGILPTLPALP